MFLVLSGCSKSNISYVDTDSWTWYNNDSTPDVNVTGERVKQTACILTFNARSEKERYIDREYAIYRLDNGEWKRLKAIRAIPGFNRGQNTLKPDETLKRYYDWSYEYGTLPRGTYKLVTHWYEKQFTDSFGVEWDFIITAKDKYPKQDYGYSGIDTDEVTMSAVSISDHLWTLTVEGTTFTRWNVEPSYSIYKLDKDIWSEVEQTVNLSPDFDQPRGATRTGKETTWIISLANIYPELDAGTYRFVKRTMKTAETNSFADWNLLPKESFSYVSAEFILYDRISWKYFDTDPISWSRYTPYKSTYNNIKTSVSGISPEGCDLNIENNEKYNISISYYFILWRFADGQWLPLAHKRYVSDGLVAWTVPKGKTESKTVKWDVQYGSLEEGEYRLTAESDPKISEPAFIVWDFTVS